MNMHNLKYFNADENMLPGDKWYASRENISVHWIAEYMNELGDAKWHFLQW